ncbi:MAG: hypothetical protein RRX93_04280 [Bacteroidales bacterium]
MRILYSLLIYPIIFFASLANLRAQVIVYEDFVPEKQKIYSKERFFYGYIQTAGFGLGYEQGHYNKKFVYSGWNIEFATQLDPKRFGNNWYRGRKYVYGQINSFCMLRVGYGSSYVFNDKPFWGGVTIALRYSGGLSLGLAFPQYLYILYDSTGNDIRLEKMNPNNPKHLQIENILRRGPYMKGVWHLRPYPGIYAKIGLNFEFGKTQERSHAIEAGLMYDFYFTRIPIMAKNKYPMGFLNFYIAYRFGKRYGQL